jgi:hypothetical protein
MKDNENRHPCIHDGDRKCLEYERKVYKLEVLKVILTPKMILTVGFTIMTIISMSKGG